MNVKRYGGAKDRRGSKGSRSLVEQASRRGGR